MGQSDTKPRATTIPLMKGGRGKTAASADEPKMPVKRIICFASLFFCIGQLYTIAFIVIGAKHKDECPAEPMIPIYLIVAGSVSFIASILGLIKAWAEHKDNQTTLKTLKAISGIMSIFSFIWLIVGSVYTYQIYEPVYGDTLSHDYCHKTVYLFSFVTLTITWCLIPFAIILSLCICFCGSLFVCCSRNK